MKKDGYTKRRKGKYSKHLIPRLHFTDSQPPKGVESPK